MKNKTAFGILFLSALSLVFSGSGCIQQPLPVHYYTLGIPEQEVPAITAPSPTSLLVGPVNIASFLDQGQLVTQNSRYSITIEEQHRWAGDLREMLANALITNLSLDLGPERIYNFPAPAKTTALQVVTDFLHFEKDSGGHAYVVVRWKIMAADGQSTLYKTISNYRIIPENDAFDSLVKALSQGLSKLSGEISDRVTILTSS